MTIEVYLWGAVLVAFTCGILMPFFQLSDDRGERIAYSALILLVALGWPALLVIFMLAIPPTIGYVLGLALHLCFRKPHE